MLERVIDFLTLGKLHKRFATEYDNFTAAVTKAIEDNNKNQGRYTIPQELTLDYEGYQVSFTPTHGADDEPKMVIEIAGAAEKKKLAKTATKISAPCNYLRKTSYCAMPIFLLRKMACLTLKMLILPAFPYLESI
ncbi:hypothetical protein [Sodalis glossinidius]|uniref:hypothetical protein n=1 Tax=Sodalis glossinidius TaxID=63612 RepID=UPI0005A4B46C|nr:hypothetical protein [Sodalis glossinidius]